MIKCRICGHGKDKHKADGGGGKCQVAMKITYEGPRRIPHVHLCPCPGMLYTCQIEHRVRLDWMLDRRLLEYIGSLKAACDDYPTSVPGKVQVIRYAIDEYLKQRGY